MRTIGIIALFVVSVWLITLGLGLLSLFSGAAMLALSSGGRPGYDPADQIMAGLFAIVVLGLCAMVAKWLWDTAINLLS